MQQNFTKMARKMQGRAGFHAALQGGGAIMWGSLHLQPLSITAYPQLEHRAP